MKVCRDPQGLLETDFHNNHILETPWRPPGLGNSASLGPGDWGGPLFMWRSDYQEFFVIGIANRAKACHENSFDIAATFFSPTGQVGGDKENLRFIIKHVGSDQDLDGVRDDLDNCPPWRCENPLDCANPGQEDDDYDGVGDLCDNCRAADCERFEDGRSCKNFDQKDSGGVRGLGDVCDPCPTRELAYGDILSIDYISQCDLLCNATNSTQCYSDLDCLGLGRCIYGLDEHENKVLPGRCSAQADRDRDGRPDHCDECPDLPNRNRANSNRLIEDRENSANLGNVCDPVPLALFDLSPTTGNNPQKISISSHLGRDAGSHLAAKTGSVRLHYCNCYVAHGTTYSEKYPYEAACEASLCDIRDARNNLGSWRRPTIMKNGISIHPNGLDLEFSTLTKDSATVDWIWDYDVNWMETINGQSYYGLLATTVEAPTFSQRDANFYLRTVAQLGWYPLRRNELYEDPFIDYIEEKPFRIVTIPKDIPNECPPNCEYDTGTIMHAKKPGLLLFDPPRVWWEDLGTIDLTKPVSPLIEELLNSGNWAYVVRSDDFLEVEGRTKVFGTLVPRVGTPYINPLILEDDNGTITIRGGASSLTRSNQPDLVDMISNSAIQIGPNDRAAFSALGEVLYIAGGDLGSVDTFRKYSFERDTVETVRMTPDETLEGPVLGLAYDVTRSQLYMLRVEQTTDIPFARMRRFDLSSGTEQLVFEVPFTGNYSLTSLGLDSEGNPFIAASDQNGIDAWYFEPAADGQLSFVGNTVITGSLVDQILPSGHLPVVVNGQFSLKELGRADFEGLTPPTQL